MKSDSICESCAFSDCCPSAYFDPFGKNFCGDYRSMKSKDFCKLPVESNKVIKEREKE